MPAKKKAKRMPEVIIGVSGGVASVVKFARGVAVDIIDYDVEGCDDADLCHCARGQGEAHEHRI